MHNSSTALAILPCLIKQTWQKKHANAKKCVFYKVYFINAIDMAAWHDMLGKEV